MQHRELQETHRGRNQGHVALLQNRGETEVRKEVRGIRKVHLRKCLINARAKIGLKEDVTSDK